MAWVRPEMKTGCAKAARWGGGQGGPGRGCLLVAAAQHALVVGDDDFHAAVHGAAFGGGVVGDGVFLAVALEL